MTQKELINATTMLLEIWYKAKAETTNQWEDEYYTGKIDAAELILSYIKETKEQKP